MSTSQGSVEIPEFIGQWFMQPTYVGDGNAVDIAHTSERLGLDYFDVSGGRDFDSVTTLVVQEVTRRIGDSQLRPVVWLMMSRAQYDMVRLSMAHLPAVFANGGADE